MLCGCGYDIVKKGEKRERGEDHILKQYNLVQLNYMAKVKIEPCAVEIIQFLR